MTLENEKRFLLLLSSEKCGNGATKADVLNKIETNGWIILTDNDQKMKENRNELVWRNDIAFTRKHLAQEGMFVDGIRNDWSITEVGKQKLKELAEEVSHENSFKKISNKLVAEVKTNKILIFR